MRYLLDVNALIALGISRHEFRSRVRTWIASLSASGIPNLSTCSITELGFVRIVSQIAAYNVTVEQAKTQLDILKASNAYSFSFINDDHDVSKLPSWVQSAKHTTDGRLLELAKANCCQLATFDENIPGAFVIP